MDYLKNKFSKQHCCVMLAIFFIGFAMADDQLLVQYYVNGNSISSQLPLISQSIQQYNPTKITIIYPAVMQFLVNEVVSSVDPQNKVPVYLSPIYPYSAPYYNYPSGQVVVNLIGQPALPATSSPAADTGSFFDYTNHNSGFFNN